MAKFDLIIDTSIFGAAVALRDVEKGLVYCEVAADVQNSARQLPLMVDDAIRHGKSAITEINRVIVSQGPGSFTGIRVGIAYAYGFFKGLLELRSSAVVMAGVSSLELLAGHLSQKTSSDIALLLPSTKTTGFCAIVKHGVSSLLAVDLAKDDGGNLKSLDWKILGNWDGLTEKADILNAKSVEILDIRGSARLALAAINDKLSADTKFNWSVEMPSAIYLRKSTVEEKAQL